MLKVKSLKRMIERMETFRKLLYIFLLLILPLILVGMIMIIQYSRQVEDNTCDVLQTQLEYQTKKLEGEMERIRSITLELLNDKDLNQLVYMTNQYGNYEKSRMILVLQKELTMIKSTQAYISNVRIILPQLNRIINADGYRKGSYMDLTEEVLGHYSVNDNITGMGITERDGQIVLPLCIYDSKGQFLYGVEVEFSANGLKEVFSHALNASDTQFLFQIPEEGIRITNKSGGKQEELIQKLAKVKQGKYAVIDLDGKEWYVFHTVSNYMNCILYECVGAEEIISPINKVLGLTLLFVGIVIVCIVIFFRSAHGLVNKPLVDLTKALQKVEQGDFSIRLKEEKQNDFGYLYHGFNKMSDNLEKQIYNVYCQKILLQKMELKQLQAQINPHFLYNSYFLLHRLIRKQDYDSAVETSKKMGIYFKYMNRNGRDVVTLEEENRHATIYADVQGMRFAGRIRVEYEELPKEYKDYPIPPLVIQPILENTFGHGLENKEEDGFLRVSFIKWQEKLGFSIRIEDNGEELKQEDLDRIEESLSQNVMEAGGEVTGIVNIHRRLQIFYGEEGGLCVKRSELGGLCVDMHIPRKGDETCTDC